MEAFWTELVSALSVFFCGVVIGWLIKKRFFTKREDELLGKILTERNEVIQLEQEKKWLAEELGNKGIGQLDPKFFRPGWVKPEEESVQ